VNVYTEQQLRTQARTSPAHSAYWVDVWFANNRQASDQYTAQHREHLRTWLIRFGRFAEPPKEKV
jgi:hypothetical protein